MQQRSEETRTRILEAALRRFANHGYDAASVDEICTDAGVSKGAFYHHFPTKQDIFLELLNGWLTVVDTGLEAARRNSVPETLLGMTAALPGIFASADGRLPMFLEFWLQASRDETVWQATISPYQRYQQYFAALIEQGKAEGSFRSDVNAHSAAHALVGFAVGLLLQGLLAPEGIDWEKSAREGVEIFLRGLR